MRSVVVVLPASMCAMMPMLRTLLRSVVMSTATESLFLRGRKRLGCGRRTPVWGTVFPSRRSPAVVGEGLVGLGHLVGVLALLHSGTEAVGGVEDLVHEALGHRLLATVSGVAHEPTQGERGAPAGLDLDRHLVGGAADATGLDLDGGLDVVERALERHDRVGAGLLTGALEGAVDDALRDLLLAVLEHLGDELRDELGPVDGVHVDRPLRGGTLPWH